MQRASRNKNNDITYLFPPEHHGNPISNDGSLVTYHWGFDITALIRRAGAGDACILSYNDEGLGIEGEYSEVTIQTKDIANLRERLSTKLNITKQDEVYITKR